MLAAGAYNAGRFSDVAVCGQTFTITIKR